MTRPPPRPAKAITITSRYDSSRPRRLVAVELSCSACGRTWPAETSRGGVWTAGGLDRQVREHKCDTTT
jgi:hypothetical protein